MGYQVAPANPNDCTDSRPQQRSVPNPRRVLHVITGLDVGGAEMNLYRLLATLDRSSFEPEVMSLLARGPMAEKIAALGIPVHSLNWRGRHVNLTRLRRLIGIVRAWSPHLLQGWMYHANLVVSLAAGCTRRRIPVVWNVRHSLDCLEAERTHTRWAIRAGALLSRQPSTIIYNSQTSARQHECCGYRGDRAVVIPNGFDTSCFKPSDDRRSQCRRDLEIGPRELVVGMVARYHPMKDHQNFLEAAQRIHAQRPNVIFVLAGRGVTSENARLWRGRSTEAFGGSVRLLGQVDDVPRLMAGLDVLVSASAYGEGFPNVVGEAMASGVPCIVTDTGDSAHLVGRPEFVVPPRNAEMLASTVITLIDMGHNSRRRRGLEARNRIINEFSLDRTSAQYAGVYEALFERARQLSHPTNRRSGGPSGG